MKTKLKILDVAQEIMEKDAISSFPNECCGFFYGSDEDERIVELAVPVENKKEGDQRRRFEIAPIDYMKAEQFALANKLKLLGIYHSHPLHPTTPSEHDRKQAMPWFSYIILSVIDDRVLETDSFQLNEDRQFEKEKIEVITEKIKL